MVYRGRLIAAAHHAIRTLGIATLRPVVAPISGVNQLAIGIGIAVLQQITGFLPAENVECGRTPGGALVVALAYQKFEEQWRHVELPFLPAVGKDGAEQPA